MSPTHLRRDLCTHFVPGHILHAWVALLAQTKQFFQVAERINTLPEHCVGVACYSLSLSTLGIVSLLILAILVTEHCFLHDLLRNFQIFFVAKSYFYIDI